MWKFGQIQGFLELSLVYSLVETSRVSGLKDQGALINVYLTFI